MYNIFLYKTKLYASFEYNKWFEDVLDKSHYTL